MSGPLRLHLVLGTSTGGVGQHVRSLTDGLLGHGVDVQVLGPGATDPLFGFSDAGARFRAVEISSAPHPFRDLAAVRALRTGLSGADVVHAHGLRAGLLSGLALPRRRAPLVLTLHNAVLGSGRRRQVMEALQGVTVRRADVVLGASRDLTAGARAQGARDAREGPVSAPAMGAAQRSRAAVRAELGVVDDRPVLLAVGRLQSQKGFDVLLDALALPGPQRYRPRVVIAGDGPDEARLQAQASSQGVDLLLLGRRTDIPDLLAAADLVVLPSRWEARSLVAQEALRAGRPLVASDVGGLPDLLAPDAGVLVPVGDVAALGAAITALLEDPAERSALAGRGLARSAGWPDEAATVAHLLALYRELIEARRS